MVNYKYSGNTEILITMYEGYTHNMTWLTSKLETFNLTTDIIKVRLTMLNWIRNLATALLADDNEEFWDQYTTLLKSLTKEEKAEVLRLIDEEIQLSTYERDILSFNFDCKKVTHIALLIIWENLHSMGMSFVDYIVGYGRDKPIEFDEKGFLSKDDYNYILEYRHAYVIDGVAIHHLETESLPFKCFRKYGNDYGLSNIYGSNDKAYYVLKKYDDLDDRYTKDYDSIKLFSLSSKAKDIPARHRLEHVKKKTLIIEMCKFLFRDAESDYQLIDPDHFENWLIDVNNQAIANPTRLFFITSVKPICGNMSVKFKHIAYKIGFQLQPNLYFYNGVMRDAFWSIPFGDRHPLYENIETSESETTSTREVFKRFKTKIPG